MESQQGPLNTCHPHKFDATINKAYTFLYCITTSTIIYYRISTFNYSKNNHLVLPWLLVFFSELILSIFYLLGLAYRWQPVTRTAFPARLPADEELPAIDVFVFTADPVKEPPIKVMNTVISAMALDYPPEKIAVYLSDDGGSSITLEAAKLGFEFAKCWIPFCRKYKVITRCPQAYFAQIDDYLEGVDDHDVEFIEAQMEMKEKFKVFQDRVAMAQERAEHECIELNVALDRSPSIEVIRNGENEGDQTAKAIPLLIYVAREKRPHHPHHFKAGAINVLLRVSGVITNSPYILALDCDMYSNDPMSARQAMCFHLDPNISNSLAFVQFPQKFHNISKHNDIYDSQLRPIFEIKWAGVDGLKGPTVSGTCFYMKRAALYDDIHLKEIELPQLKQYFGPSNEFIKSLRHNHPLEIKQDDLSSTLLREANFLASSTYEQNSKWGEQVGFLYGSVVEDYFTGFMLHCRGWNSVFYNPPRPAFLGTATTNLNDLLIQESRWQSGFIDVTLSRFFPLFYGPLVKKMSLLQSMCYGYFAIQPFCFLPLWVLATIPQLCLLHGIAIYPKATSPWFVLFSFAFLSSLFKYLADVLITGGSIKTWWNEERIWMIKGVTSFLYGSLDGIFKKLGLRQASFITTNKVDDEEKNKLYYLGKFNFQTSKMFLIPLVGLVVFNTASFIGGVLRAVISHNRWDEFLGQILVSFFVLIVGYPVIEGVLLRNDKGSIHWRVTLASGIVSLGMFCITSFSLLG